MARREDWRHDPVSTYGSSSTITLTEEELAVISGKTVEQIRKDVEEARLWKSKEGARAWKYSDAGSGKYAFSEEDAKASAASGYPVTFCVVWYVKDKDNKYHFKEMTPEEREVWILENPASPRHTR